MSLSCTVLACDSSEREQPAASAEPQAPKQDVGTTPPVPFSVHPVAKPKRETTIRIEDIKEIEVIDLKVSEPPDFTQGKVGRPRELLRAKHLRLSAGSPMAKNRGLVLVTEGPGYRAKTLEAVLVDFKTGEVARFADARGPLKGMDAAFGKQLGADGWLQSVLIHADGLAVPWVPEGQYQALLDVVMNYGHKEIYLFAHNTKWADNGLGTVFSKWTDLRKPPPPLTLELPFQPLATRHSHTSFFGQYNASRPGGAKRNVTASFRGGKQVEILRDGTTRRIDPSAIVLGDGWHLTPGLGYEWVAYNEGLGEVQHIQVGPNCTPWDNVYDSRSYAPPRVDFTCTRDNAWLIWSPERMVRFPMTERRLAPPLKRTNNGHLAWWSGSAGDSPTDCNIVAWTDLEGLKHLKTRRLMLNSVRTSDRYIFASPCDLRVLHVIDVEANVEYQLDEQRGCAELTYTGHDDDLWSYHCLSADDRGKWLEVVDFKQLKRWRVNGVRAGAGKHWSDVWLQSETKTIVWVGHRGADDVLLAWDLR